MRKKIITFGTFDMFHIGHLNILERARSLGTELVVGVSSDKLSFEKKSRSPICSKHDRASIISALRCVDQVFFEESLELKSQYIQDYQADCLVMGEDWLGRFDNMDTFCDVIYLPRTPSISTTEIIEIARLTES